MRRLSCTLAATPQRQLVATPAQLRGGQTFTFMRSARHVRAAHLALRRAAPRAPTLPDGGAPGSRALRRRGAGAPSDA